MASEIENLRQSIIELTTAIKGGSGKGSSSGGGIKQGLTAGLTDAALAGIFINPNKAIGSVLTAINSMAANLTVGTAKIDTTFMNLALSIKKIAEKFANSFAGIEDPFSRGMRYASHVVGRQAQSFAVNQHELGEAHGDIAEGMQAKSAADQELKQKGKNSQSTKRVNTGMELLSGGIKKLGASFLTLGGAVALATRGLSGTREAYLLNYSQQHYFFEVSDELRDVIRFFTNEIEGAANVMHHLNNMPEDGIGGKAISSLKTEVLGNNFGLPGMGMVKDFFTTAKKVITGKDAEKSPHLQPMLQTSFGSVADLQNKLQSLSTENPAGDRQLSISESIYNVLVGIYDKMGGNLPTISESGIKKD